MSFAESAALASRISLLEFLIQRGWKPLRDSGGEDVAGLCSLHRKQSPSLYVNRHKQVSYCIAGQMWS